METIVVQKHCDIHGEDNKVEATETLEVRWLGSNYVVDVCAEHGAEIKSTMAVVVSHGRKLNGARKQKKSPEQREYLARVRRVLEEAGQPVHAKGRIPVASMREAERLMAAAATKVNGTKRPAKVDKEPASV